MKFSLTVFLFFLFSLLLIFVTIQRTAHVLYFEQSEKIRINQIQLSSAKIFERTRKVYVPKRSFSLAGEEIKNILLKTPIHFEVNDSDLLEKLVLEKVVKVVNNMNEDVVLSISAHTDASGTAKQNLHLSQRRADSLKGYFAKRTNLPFIVAIGYGEVFALKNKLIEVNLKRIK